MERKCTHSRSSYLSLSLVVCLLLLFFPRMTSLPSLTYILCCALRPLSFSSCASPSCEKCYNRIQSKTSLSLFLPLCLYLCCMPGHIRRNLIFVCRHLPLGQTATTTTTTTNTRNVKKMFFSLFPIFFSSLVFIELVSSHFHSLYKILAPKW